MHWVSARGVLSMAVLLLDKGATAEPKNKQGSTPLHKASNNGQVRSGCPQSRTACSVETLTGAPAFSQITVVQKLVQVGCDINCQDGDGNTPLVRDPPARLQAASSIASDRTAVACCSTSPHEAASTSF